MRTIIGKYATSVTMFTAFVCIIAAVVYGFILPNAYVTAFPFILAFFYVFGFVGMAVYNRSLKRTQGKATIYYLATRFTKMFIVLIGALVYGIVDRKEVVPFLITLAVVYLLYLVFETWFYYTLTKGGNIKSINDETKD
jgi:hypothetical protein